MAPRDLALIRLAALAVALVIAAVVVLTITGDIDPAGALATLGGVLVVANGALGRLGPPTAPTQEPTP